jgi:hypothetical protein
MAYSAISVCVLCCGMRCPRARCGCTRYGFRSRNKSLLHELVYATVLQDGVQRKWQYCQQNWFLLLGGLLATQVVLLCFRVAEVTTCSYVAAFAPLYAVTAMLAAFTCAPGVIKDLKRDVSSTAPITAVGSALWLLVVTPLLMFVVMLALKLDGHLGTHIGMRHVMVPLFVQAALVFVAMCCGLCMDNSDAFTRIFFACGYCGTIGMVVCFEVLVAVYYDTADHGNVSYGVMFITIGLTLLLCCGLGSYLTFDDHNVTFFLPCCFRERFSQSRTENVARHAIAKANAQSVDAEALAVSMHAQANRARVPLYIA